MLVIFQQSNAETLGRLPLEIGNTSSCIMYNVRQVSPSLAPRCLNWWYKKENVYILWQPSVSLGQSFRVCEWAFRLAAYVICLNVTTAHYIWLSASGGSRGTVRASFGLGTNLYVVAQLAGNCQRWIIIGILIITISTRSIVKYTMSVIVYNNPRMIPIWDAF